MRDIMAYPRRIWVVAGVHAILGSDVLSVPA